MTTIRATIRRITAGMIAAVALAACGAHEEGQQRPPPPPVEDTAFGPMVGTMDKARGVEDTTLQHKEDMDQELQRQEGANGAGDP
jgi:hypothetical protein